MAKDGGLLGATMKANRCTRSIKCVCNEMRAGLWGRLGVVTDPNVGGGFLLDDGRPIYGDFFVIVHSFDRRNVFCVPGKGDFVGFQFGPVARNW